MKKLTVNKKVNGTRPAPENQVWSNPGKGQYSYHGNKYKRFFDAPRITDGRDPEKAPVFAVYEMIIFGL